MFYTSQFSIRNVLSREQVFNLNFNKSYFTPITKGEKAILAGTFGIQFLLIIETKCNIN